VVFCSPSAAGPPRIRPGISGAAGILSEREEFFLHVSGKAFIVTDPEEINGLVHDDIRELASDQMVLIKVKMMKADYFESSGDVAHATGWWKDVRTQLHSWMFNTRPGYKPYYLADAPMPMLSTPVA